MKEAKTDLPLLPAIKERWSPRAFDSKPVSREAILTIFEAARWAASAFNEQPWRFIVGEKGTESWDKLFSVLLPGNQLWNGNSPVLALIIAKKTYTLNGNPNRTAGYETGGAAAAATIQARGLGLYAHQMGGVDFVKARAVFNIPDDYEPMAAMSVGYLGDPETLTENFKKSELAERTRKPIAELLFETVWDKAY